MPTPEIVLHAALQAAPRRYAMPSLPPTADAAWAAGLDTALAFAMEQHRLAFEARSVPPAAAQQLFTRALAERIRQAMAPEGGDPGYQALVLRASIPEVDEHARLQGQAAADRRDVNSAVDAIAHPGKLRRQPPGPLRDALARLHELAAKGAWSELRSAAGELREGALTSTEARVRATLDAVQALPALERLERAAALLPLEPVQRYESLRERDSPRAGTPEATARGRAAGSAGEQSEAITLVALRELTRLLDAADPGGLPHRVLRSLRLPVGFQGEARRAKAEWDAAIARAPAAGAPLAILLLAEVKSSPAAATNDLARLLRGLQQFVHAEPGGGAEWPSADGPVLLAGDSLQRLVPVGDELPPHVIYCCAAPPEQRPPPLAAASRAQLMEEAASVAFARRLASGEPVADAQLAPVWASLATDPRLHPVRDQYETARRARAAMLHPDDLLAAVAQCLSSNAGRTS